MNIETMLWHSIKGTLQKPSSLRIAKESFPED